MYKLLLSWRYLRTRYIALASVVSVTLGVATLVVVNSVMDGFSYEMHKRLHGILSDLVVESAGLEGIPDPEWHMEEIRHTLGDDVEGMTAVVRTPAMLHFQHRGENIVQQVVLVGIDDSTYARVGDFSQYLMNSDNRGSLSFDLREAGYDERLPPSGWDYRRSRAAYEALMTQPAEGASQAAFAAPSAGADPVIPASYAEEAPPSASPEDPARLPADPLSAAPLAAAPASPAADGAPFAPPQDPFAAGRPAETENVFDPSREQHTGVVLGIALASTRFRDETGAVQDYFLCRPGDDVQVTLPTAGTPPKLVSTTFTVVDLYESKMSEYDSLLVFCPLSRLQDLRGMVDPLSGVGSVTSIQIKLREGADLNACRDRLRERFPPETNPYRIQTWREMQGPLLAAVRLETTILNILLFLIIAVAGFGILSTFFMIVVEKTRDIGVLKALGAPRSGVMSIFLTYGLALGAVGSGVGTGLGLLFVIYINHIAAGIELLTGREVFDPTVYYFQEIPTLIDPFTCAWVTVGAMLIAVLASVLPALRAARLHPVEALRYE